jgi:hypothetical protein
MKTLIVSKVYDSNNVNILCDTKQHYYQTNDRIRYISKCRQWLTCGVNPRIEVVK